MTVRITDLEQSHGRALRVDGRLVACDVATLEEALGDRVRGTRLELADLRSADAAGVAALRGIEARGALLHGAAPFLRLLLGEGTHDARPTDAGHE